MSEYIINTDFFNACMDVLRKLAAVRTPLWDSIMSIVTVLGQEMAFIVIGLVILWCVDKRFGYRFLFMYMLGTAVNQILKAIFMIPRPWLIDPDLSIVESAREAATGFSFPSGHTQSAVLMFGGLAALIKKKWAYIAAAVIALAVGFSRLYLGVHTPLDVGVSLIAGLIILLICMRKNNRLTESRGRYLWAVGIVAAFSAALLFYIKFVCAKAQIPYCTEVQAQELVFLANKDAWTLFGTVMGLLLGYAVESRYINYNEKAVWWVQVIKVVLGLAIVIALRVVLKGVLGLISESPAMNGIRYFIMCFVALAVYPLLFKPLSKLGKKA